MVLRAGAKDQSGNEEALSFLCERYWYPLYVFVRRKGVPTEQAEDATQSFFTRLIQKQILEHALPSRGRFRSFLMTSMQNFLSNEWDKARTEKRGGGRKLFSFDVNEGESKLGLEPSHQLTPEKIFDRAWAIQLLELVVRRLKKEQLTRKKGAEFEILSPFLAGRFAAESYEQAAQQLGISSEATRQAASRLRKRYRELLREEVAQTVSAKEDIEDEILKLFEALSA